MDLVLVALSAAAGAGCSLLAFGLAALAWSRSRRLVGERADLEQRLVHVEATAARLAAVEAERDGARADLAAESARRADLELVKSQAQKREQSILEVQEAFLARMSHELRTPLNAVSGYTEMLLEDAHGSTKADLERIRIASANLSALVTSVLDLSEIQSGDFAIRPEVLRVDEVVGRVVDASRFVADQQRDTVEVTVEPDLAVTLDKRMVQSILFHLVSNACKFTLKGTVRIVARSLQTDLLGVPTDALEIVVSDTGIGMTPRQIEAAFQPFKQGDDSFTRRYDGGGVGLAVVSGFVRAMGGDVAIHSTAGAGATVKVLLPKEVRARSEAFGDDEDTILLR